VFLGFNKMDMEFEKKGDVGVLKIAGRLDASNASQLKSQFSDYLTETTKFVLDMRELETVDSTGLGAIVACLKYASEAEGDLRIAVLQSKPKMVFELTRAYRVFDIYDSVDAAVDSFSGITTGVF